MKAKAQPEGRVSNALAELVVVPRTCLRARLASGRFGLTGERSGVLLKGEGDDGVSLMPPGPPHAGLIIRELDGVSDMACRNMGEGVVWRYQTSPPTVMAGAGCACRRGAVGEVMEEWGIHVRQLYRPQLGSGRRAIDVGEGRMGE